MILLACWLVGLFAGWLVCWMVGWVDGWSIGGWMVGGGKKGSREEERKRGRVDEVAS